MVSWLHHMELRGKKVLVTGGAGFIGSHTVDALLQEGADVFIIDDLSTGRRENLNPNARFYKINLADPAINTILDQERPDIIYHFAYYVLVPKSSLNPFLDFPVLEGTIHILQKARELDVKKFVLASSGFVYGNNPNLPVPETEPIDPVCSYVITKQAIEQYLESYRRTHGIPYVILRYPAVYGPRQVTGAMADYVRKLRADVQAEIWGDGTKTRDYVYIDDVVRANLLALDVADNHPNPIFNVGTGKETTLNDLYWKIATLLEKEAKPIYYPDRPGEQIRYSLSAEKIKQELGWEPQTPFETGLKKVIEHWEQKPPLMSAIITTFNRSGYCKQAIESVLAQTYTNFELLVLDNSSSDDTEAVVTSFNDDRIRYIRHEPLNIAQARNLGWQRARGRYVGFLDDDDRWLPNKLEAQLKVFEDADREPALVYGGFIKINQDNESIGHHAPVLKGMILKELIEQYDAFTGSASNPIIRKDVIEELNGYDERVVTGEDWEFYMRLAERYSIDYTDEMVLEIRQHAGPRLGDKLKEAAELELHVYNQYRIIFDETPWLASFYFQKIGGKYIRSGEKRLGRSYLRKAVQVYPRNVLAYIQYILSFFGSSLYLKIHTLQQKYFKKTPVELIR